MLTHREIVSRANSEAELAAKLRVNAHQVRDWKRRDRIPPEHWQDIARIRLATLKELAKAAATRREGAE
jgi:hypothetical protein